MAVRRDRDLRHVHLRPWLRRSSSTPRTTPNSDVSPCRLRERARVPAAAAARRARGGCARPRRSAARTRSARPARRSAPRATGGPGRNGFRERVAAPNAAPFAMCIASPTAGHSSPARDRLAEQLDVRRSRRRRRACRAAPAPPRPPRRPRRRLRRARFVSSLIACSVTRPGTRVEKAWLATAAPITRARARAGSTRSSTGSSRVVLQPLLMLLFRLQRIGREHIPRGRRDPRAEPPQLPRPVGRRHAASAARSTSSPSRSSSTTR